MSLESMAVNSSPRWPRARIRIYRVVQGLHVFCVPASCGSAVCFIALAECNEIIQNSRDTKKVQREYWSTSVINVIYILCFHLFADLSCGAQPLQTITRPPRAWVHHYGNNQVSVKYWNKWMPAKCTSQRWYFHRAGFCRFV